MILNNCQNIPKKLKLKKMKILKLKIYLQEKIEIIDFLTRYLNLFFLLFFVLKYLINIHERNRLRFIHVNLFLRRKNFLNWIRLKSNRKFRNCSRTCMRRWSDSSCRKNQKKTLWASGRCERLVRSKYCSSLMRS